MNEKQTKMANDFLDSFNKTPSVSEKQKQPWQDKIISAAKNIKELNNNQRNNIQYIERSIYSRKENLMNQLLLIIPKHKHKQFNKECQK